MKRRATVLVLAAMLLAALTACPGPGALAQEPRSLSDLAAIEVVSLSPSPGTPYENNTLEPLEIELALDYQLREPCNIQMRVGLGSRSLPYFQYVGVLPSYSETLTVQAYFDLDWVRRWVEDRGGDLADGLYLRIQFTTWSPGASTGTTYDGPFTYGSEEIRDGVLAMYPLAQVPRPRDLTASRVNGSVVLTWNPPRGNGSLTPTGYAVYRSTGLEAAPVLLGTTALSETHFVDTSPGSATSCTYSVKAFAGSPAAASSVPATALLTEPAPSSLWVNRPPGEDSQPLSLTCAVITTEDLRPAFMRLAYSKTRRGTPTAVYTTDWIYSHYPSAADHAARVKMFLTDLRAKEGVKYVVLGGDARTVPTRIIITGDGCFPSYPTDHYYADLSEWDGNRNGLYVDFDGDRPDLKPELVVGRLPVATPESAALMVDRLLYYEKSPPAGDWFTRAVLAAGVIGYPDEEGSKEARPDNDGAVIVEQIAGELLPARFDRVTLYERGGIAPSEYPSDLPLDLGHFGSAVSEGCSLVLVVSHGWKTWLYSQVWIADSDGNGVCGVGEDQLNVFVNDYRGLPTGGPELPFMFAEACLSADFSHRPYCLGEHLVSNGSVVGYIGSTFVAYSTSDWTPASNDDLGRTLTWYFWQEFFSPDLGASRPGEALARAKERYVGGIRPTDLYAKFNGHLETVTEFSLLGDPEMLVWTDTPREMAMLVEPSAESLVVTVKGEEGRPLPGVDVCVWDGGDGVYLRGRTGDDGVARFTLPDLLETVLDVTAFMPGYRWSESRVAVASGAARPVDVVTDDLDGLPEGPALRRLVALEIIGGYGDGRLGPGDLVTREQFAKMLLLASEIEPEPGLTPTFADAGDISPWATPYVATAAARGLVGGVGGNRFAPLDNVTRAQVLTMMARALGAPESTAVTPFPDDAAIPIWARGPVNFALATGLLRLEDFRELAPGTLATRAECALLLSRYIDILRGG